MTNVLTYAGPQGRRWKWFGWISLSAAAAAWAEELASDWMLNTLERWLSDPGTRPVRCDWFPILMVMVLLVLMALSFGFGVVGFVLKGSRKVAMLGLLLVAMLVVSLFMQWK